MVTNFPDFRHFARGRQRLYRAPPYLLIFLTWAQSGGVGYRARRLGGIVFLQAGVFRFFYVSYGQPNSSS